MILFRPRTESPVLAERTRSELDLRDGVLFPVDSNEPFEGTLVEYYPGKVKKAAIEIRGGRAHGVTRGWFENGQQEVEEHFRNGVSHGLRRRWYADGQRKSETKIVEGVVSGRYIKWHENGEKAIEMTLVDSEADGLSLAWHPSGKLKSRAIMDEGEIVEQEFFEDEGDRSLP